MSAGMKRHATFFTSLMLSALGPYLLGCEFIAKKATEKAVETATGNAVSIDGDKIEIQTEKGKAVVKQEGGKVTVDGPEGKVVIDHGGDGERPKDFPLPFPEDASVMRSSSMDAEGGGTMYTAVMKSEASPATLGEFYKKHLEEQGFTVKRTETKMGPMNMVLVAAEKGKIQAGAQIMAGAGDPGTMVNLSWVEKK